MVKANKEQFEEQLWLEQAKFEEQMQQERASFQGQLQFSKSYFEHEVSVLKGQTSKQEQSLFQAYKKKLYETTRRHAAREEEILQTLSSSAQ
eukprot:12924987-Prorocentrum_lima.AAC.1